MNDKVIEIVTEKLIYGNRFCLHQWFSSLVKDLQYENTTFAPLLHKNTIIEEVIKVLKHIYSYFLCSI